MAVSINPFISDHIPNYLWPALINEFGRQVIYQPIVGESETLAVVWKEGASDEEISPGRYSQIWVRNADLPVLPALGDSVEKDDKQYDVVRIDATAYDFSRIVLQETGPLL